MADDRTELALHGELARTRTEVAATQAALAETRAALHRLQHDVAELRGIPAPAPIAPAGVCVAEPDGGGAAPRPGRLPVSRRRVLGLAAAGATGVALATVAAVPAAANDPGDVTIGATKFNATPNATQVFTTDYLFGAQVLFQSGQVGSPVGAWSPALAGAVGTDGASGIGVLGTNLKDHGIGVMGGATGDSSIGGFFYGHDAAVFLASDGGSGPPAATGYLGNLQCLDDGLWFGLGDGVWRKVQGSDTAGALHAIDPVRVYDSRVVGARTPIGVGQTRVVSVANQIDQGGGVAGDAVPSGATAVVANLTVVHTATGPGYLSVTPAGGHTTSSIKLDRCGNGPGQRADDRNLGPVHAQRLCQPGHALPDRRFGLLPLDKAKVSASDVTRSAHRSERRWRRVRPLPTALTVPGM